VPRLDPGVLFSNLVESCLGHGQAFAFCESGEMLWVLRVLDFGHVDNYRECRGDIGDDELDGHEPGLD
jgi:hypothetical protein